MAERIKVLDKYIVYKMSSGNHSRHGHRHRSGRGSGRGSDQQPDNRMATSEQAYGAPESTQESSYGGQNPQAQSSYGEGTYQTPYGHNPQAQSSYGGVTYQTPYQTPYGQNPQAPSSYGGGTYQTPYGQNPQAQSSYGGGAYQTPYGQNPQAPSSYGGNTSQTPYEQTYQPQYPVQNQQATTGAIVPTNTTSSMPPPPVPETYRVPSTVVGTLSGNGFIDEHGVFHPDSPIRGLTASAAPVAGGPETELRAVGDHPGLDNPMSPTQVAPFAERHIAENDRIAQQNRANAQAAHDAQVAARRRQERRDALGADRQRRSRR
ncbi:hypothetical protein ACMFMG_009250 [Clarireedia jacksonii]